MERPSTQSNFAWLQDQTFSEKKILISFIMLTNDLELLHDLMKDQWTIDISGTQKKPMPREDNDKN